jgi:hypothetical protein
MPLSFLFDFSAPAFDRDFAIATIFFAMGAIHC